MESLETDSEAEKIVAASLRAWRKDQADGAIGRPSEKAIVAALREADLLKD